MRINLRHKLDRLRELVNILSVYDFDSIFS